VTGRDLTGEILEPRRALLDVGRERIRMDHLSKCQLKGCWHGEPHSVREKTSTRRASETLRGAHPSAASRRTSEEIQCT
jgi:hypothetical protein